MARKQKPPDAPPSKAYLLSFGDTMTTLLAFFIILCSLAEEQTGANLHTGTGSFVSTLSTAGLPGDFSGDGTSRPVQKSFTSPLYLAPDLDDNPPEKDPTGPDEDNGLRSVDRESEEYQRFLNELDRLSKVENMPEVEGEVEFDLFNKISYEPPYLSEAYKNALQRVLPVLRKNTHQVEIVVWATTPSPSAWTRASKQASGLMNEMAAAARLKPEQRSRLTAVGQPWLFSDVRRPVASIVVRKIDTSTIQGK